MQVRRFLNSDGRSGEDADRQMQISIYQSQLLPFINKERELSEQVGRDNFELVSVRRSIEKILQTYAKLGLKFPEGSEAARFAAARGVQTDFVAISTSTGMKRICSIAATVASQLSTSIDNTNFSRLTSRAISHAEMDETRS